jgi:hypothetical protein
VLVLAHRPVQQVHLRSLLCLLHLPCDNRQKSPTPRFARCGSPCCPPALSRLVAAPPSPVELRHVYRRTVLHPPPRPLHLVASCPVHRHIEVLPMPPFLTRRSWPLSMPVPPPRSTLARDIMRSGAGFFGCTSPLHSFLRCCKRVFQVFRCFICML